MKSLLILSILLTMSFALSAQYVQLPQQTTIDIKGSRVFMEGERLELEHAVACFSDVDGADLSQDYLKNRRYYKAGLGMTIGGASLAGVGAVTFLGGAVAALVASIPLSIAGEQMPCGINATIYTGAFSFIGGVAVFAAGLPTLCVYKKRLNKLEAAYNAPMVQTQPELTFGPQPSGIGIGLRF